MILKIRKHESWHEWVWGVFNQGTHRVLVGCMLPASLRMIVLVQLRFLFQERTFRMPE